MKKRGFLIFVVLLCAFMMAACGNHNGISSGFDASLTEPYTVIDQAGREVVIAKTPERIVSSYYITTSALIALDLTEQIKGIESEPGKRPLYAKCAPDLLEVTQVGNPKEFDLEACASIHPDLVILPVRAQEMVEPLEQLGIPVIVVNPESKEQLNEMIILIGAATGRSQRAKELTSYILEKTNYLEEKTKEADKTTVYLGGNSNLLTTASKGMYQNDQIRLAGGSNVAGEMDDTYWVESSYEQILAWNPEAIVLASDASYTVEDVLSEGTLSECQAIKDQKVYQIPSDLEAWDSPVPASFLGAFYMASELHPDLISKDEYENLVEEYYESFYGITD